MVKMWTEGDVRCLKWRVARMNPKTPVKANACVPCTHNDHHAARWVGPYLICRCLTCSAKSIVVGVAP